MNPAKTAAKIAAPVAAYLAARARAEVLAEKVAAISTALLAERVCMDDDGNRITEAAGAWEICDADAPGFYAELERRTNEAIPHDYPAGHCPALHAASDMRAAGEDLLTAMAPLFGFEGIKIHRLDLRRKMIDNGIGLVLAVEREQAA